MADFRGQVAHFGNTTGVVSHRAIGIGRQGDAQCTEHPNAGQRHGIETRIDGAIRLDAQPNAQQGCYGDDQDRSHRAHHPNSQPLNNGCRRAGLRRFGNPLRWFFGVGSVIFGGIGNAIAGYQPDHNHQPVVDADAGQQDGEERKNQDQHRGAPNGAAESGQQFFLGGVFVDLGHILFKEVHHTAEG